MTTTTPKIITADSLVEGWPDAARALYAEACGPDADDAARFMAWESTIKTVFGLPGYGLAVEVLRHYRPDLFKGAGGRGPLWISKVARMRWAGKTLLVADRPEYSGVLPVWLMAWLRAVQEGGAR